MGREKVGWPWSRPLRLELAQLPWRRSLAPGVLTDQLTQSTRKPRTSQPTPDNAGHSFGKRRKTTKDRAVSVDKSYPAIGSPAPVWA